MSDEVPNPANLFTPEDDPPDEPASAGKIAATNTDPARRRTKSNEEIIREEMRAAGQSYLNVWRSGIALLPALLLAIGFLRREVFEQMAKIDTSLKLLPFDRYILGTILLAVIAYIFSTLCVDLASRWRWYQTQLEKECDNPISVPPLSPGSRTGKSFRRVFYVFPVFDLFARLVLEAEVRGFWKQVGCWFSREKRRVRSL